MSSHHINLLFSAINNLCIYYSLHSQVTASRWWPWWALSSSSSPSGKVALYHVSRVHVLCTIMYPRVPGGLFPGHVSNITPFPRPKHRATNSQSYKSHTNKTRPGENVLVNSVPSLQAPAQSLIVRIKTFTKLLSEGPSKCNLIKLTNDKCFVQL